MDVITECPLLTPVNNEATLFSGFITANRECFQIRIQLKAPGVLKAAQIDCEWRLKEIIEEDMTIIEQRLNHCNSLGAFLTELKAIIENRMNCRKHFDKTFLPLPEFYAALINDIELLGWSRLSFIDESFREIHLVADDSKKRQHTLRIRLHHQHPDKPPECRSELPLPFHFNWNSECKLIDLATRFQECIDTHQDFWDVLDEIDAQTCVLEPENPSRNMTHRRIALGKAVSLQLEVNPTCPRTMPTICFLGADSITGPLKEKLNRNLTLWDVTSGLLRNLQAVLETEFPSTKNSKKEDFVVECGICYCYRFEDEIPDQVCEDTRCSQAFHRACLYEWLHSLPTSRQSFNLLFGECPLCSAPITVKIIS